MRMYSADRQLCRDRRDFDKRRGISCTTCRVPGAESRVPCGDLRLSGAHSEGAARRGCTRSGQRARSTSPCPPPGAARGDGQGRAGPGCGEEAALSSGERAGGGWALLGSAGLGGTMPSYTVTVATGSQWFAGTDDYVYLSLEGTAGCSERHLLDKPFYNDFERGAVSARLGGGWSGGSGASL